MREVVSAAFPTRFGNFTIHLFSENGAERIALTKGKLNGYMLVRIHSRCLTGDTFASLRCDCREQMENALRAIGKARSGVFIYLDQGKAVA